MPLTIPRSADRGPIEAKPAGVIALTATQQFRDQLIAAPLKLFQSVRNVLCRVVNSAIS